MDNGLDPKVDAVLRQVLKAFESSAKTREQIEAIMEVRALLNLGY